jgi:hypothetical protein
MRPAIGCLLQASPFSLAAINGPSGAVLTLD